MRHYLVDPQLSCSWVLWLIMILKGPEYRPVRAVGVSKGKARLAMEMLQEQGGVFSCL